MGEFNSDDHYIYYCGQKSLRRNGVAIIINRRDQNAVLGCNLKNDRIGTSLIVQWLGLCAPSTGGLGSIPGQGINIPHASTEAQHSQINKYLKKKKKTE